MLTSGEPDGEQAEPEAAHQREGRPVPTQPVGLAARLPQLKQGGHDQSGAGHHPEQEPMRYGAEHGHSPQNQEDDQGRTSDVDEVQRFRTPASEGEQRAQDCGHAQNESGSLERVGHDNLVRSPPTRLCDAAQLGRSTPSTPNVRPAAVAKIAR